MVLEPNFVPDQFQVRILHYDKLEEFEHLKSPESY